MRAVVLLLVAGLFAGCARVWPRHDPSRAWIDLAAPKPTQMRASAVDQQEVSDPRFFHIEPGSHRLDLRYSFPVSPTNSGLQQGLQRDCRLALEYAEFRAGTRYRLVGGAVGFRPWARLYDEQGTLLASAREQGCSAS